MMLSSLHFKIGVLNFEFKSMIESTDRLPPLNPSPDSICPIIAQHDRSVKLWICLHAEVLQQRFLVFPKLNTQYLLC